MKKKIGARLVVFLLMFWFDWLGTGGGYNERDNVEYKERVESDDEFDDVNLDFELFTSIFLAVFFYVLKS